MSTHIVSLTYPGLFQRLHIVGYPRRWCAEADMRTHLLSVEPDITEPYNATLLTTFVLDNSVLVFFFNKNGDLC